MKIATLGADDQLAALVQWIRQAPDHQLVARFDDDSGLLGGGRSSDSGSESWEALLTQSVSDVVLVAARSRSQPQRDDQLRKLVQAAVPLVLVHPSCEMIVGYELEMIRHDSHCVMLPYHRGMYDPACARLARLVHARTEIGEIEQFVWERQSASRDRAAVMDHFTRDALLLRHLMFNISQVSATGAAPGENQYANLGVHLTGEGGELARWSIGPVRNVEGATLTVIGSSNTAQLAMPDLGAYHLTLGEGEEAPGFAPAEAGTHPASQLFDDLQRCLNSAQDDSEARWDASCRALELEDAVQRSCRRGRTIELYHERVTERDTFKSMMAAGGCGMLLWVFLLLMIAGLVEGLNLPVRNTALWRLWPAFLFVPLGLFLFLQLLIGRHDR